MNRQVSANVFALGNRTTAADLRPLDRAKAISTLVREEALASERLGRLTDKVTAAMLEANLFTIRLPQEDGGVGGTGVELFEATEEIARADGSAGWCMLISNATATFVHSGADPRARCEIFGNGPVACWATLLPKANSVETEGGFRVSGNFAHAASLPYTDAGGARHDRVRLRPGRDHRRPCKNPLQRCLRDIFTGLKHGQATPAILGRIGKVRLGLEYGEVRL
jgi:Acyl-CoA dehydrogenase, N-terminal domain